MKHSEVWKGLFDRIIISPPRDEGRDGVKFRPAGPARPELAGLLTLVWYLVYSLKAYI
jgi:hypothetical protein